MGQPNPRRVAFLGLGVMSRGMVGCAVAAGLEVTAWNRTPREVGDGVRLAASVADAIADAEVAIMCVTDDAASSAIVDAVVAADPPSGLVVVDSTTTAPATAERLAQRLASVGAGFVDAPVTGGAEGAREGRLTFLCGGDEAAFERVEPVLQALGSRVIHLGPTGSGQLTKAVNQVILAGAFLGVAEGLALAKAAGLDPARVVDVLSEGAGSSWALSARGPFMAADDYPPVGRLALHHKDLGIALAAAAALHVPLPGTELVHRLESTMVDSGRGDLDVSAVHVAVRELGGPPATPPR